MRSTVFSSPRHSQRYWVGHFTAFLCGVITPLSLAPFNLWPVAVLALLGLLALNRNLPGGKAAWRGWSYGFGLFGGGASWVYVSIHEFGNAPVPLAAALTLLFVAGIALLFHTPQFYLYNRLFRTTPLTALLGFPALWVLFEWVRSWLLTGFPWLYLGYGHLETWLAGWAPVAGIYGVSFAVALTASALYTLFTYKPLRLTALLLLAAVWGGGLALQQVHWSQEADTPPLRVKLIQGNVPLELKWQPQHRDAILELYRSMSQPYDATDLIIWPETAVPALYGQAQNFLQPIDSQLKQSKATLITGLPYREPAEGGSQGRFYNSILALGAGEGLYHKQKLVPFGEFVPLESWLRGLIEFFNLPMSSFSSGSDTQEALMAGNWHVLPLICYEVAYPDLVAQSPMRRDLLLTISDDSWFGASIGPHQHLEIARMRALENGRYLLRGTNNGISAIIDARGRIQARSGQFTREVIRGEVQRMTGITPFTRTGSWPVLALCGLLVLMVGWQAYLPKRRSMSL